MRIVVVLVVSCVCIFTVYPVVHAQEADTEPYVVGVKEEIAKAEEGKEQLFLMNHIHPLAWTNRALDRVDEISPLKFGAQANFLSN